MSNIIKLKSVFAIYFDVDEIHAEIVHETQQYDFTVKIFTLYLLQIEIDSMLPEECIFPSNFILLLNY